MTDRPILFSAPMIRAIIREIEQPGTGKTQTRRMISPQPPSVEAVRARCGADYGWWRSPAMGDWRAVGPVWAVRDIMGCEPSIRVPHATGDRLWVRETVACGACAPSKPSEWAPSFWRREQGTPRNPNGLWYMADDMAPVRPITSRGKWVPAIYMPRWASRITLTVTEVRVQRLQEISEADALAEGVEFETADPPFWYVPDIWPHSITAVGVEEPGGRHPQRSFAKLWDHINGTKPGRAWSDNPWIVALTFSAGRHNIDAAQRAEAAA